MNNQILKILLTDKRITGTHMKVYLLITLEKVMMQSQICELLLIKKQNINKIVKELLQMGYIKVHHIEGRNKYLTISWAILIEKNGEEKLYFVVETKGTNQIALLKDSEKGKIRCAKKHFKALNTDVEAVQASSYEKFVEEEVYS
ncbi:hypothetical protein [uncultured Clostridium sp.]|uniref:MarR family transcriptional regulator n=1 Tax=uncultured Clostridium sp. TaxID=59620 RepID=UPI0026085C95|nr:hypothetical protein [uncultured Clostridium sp.]